ncbi:MAG: hybrid sensor histidine kinase/response regulator [Desulfobulbaceae bacterium]
MPRYKVLYFLSLLCCVAVLFLPVFTHLYLYPAIDSLLIRDAEHQAQMVADHLAAYINVPEAGLRAEDITFELRDEIEDLAENFTLEKVKLFSNEGKVLYSTDLEDLGTVNDNDYFHTIVLRGKKFTKMVKKDSQTMEGRTVSKDVIETYVPVQGRDTVGGAFEVYYDITVLKDLLARLVHRSTIIIYGVSLLLITALMASLCKLYRSMSAREQAETALARHRDELEKQVAERTNELTRANERMKADLQRIQATEKALLVSEEKYRALVELAGDAIFAADAETGIITDVNRKGLELIGRRAEDVIGLHLVALHPDDESDLYRKIIAKHYKEAPTNKTLMVMNANGRRIPVEISSSILDYGGRKILQGIFRDISQRMRIDEELQKSERLKCASLLAGGIAHDFNNLLTAILGNLSLAQHDARNDARMLKRLHDTEDAVNRARSLTQQLMVFAKGGVPVRKTVAMGKLIEDAARFVLRGSRVKCEFSFPPDLWPAKVDAAQISQVINNLVINAAQAMSGGGTCRITGENIQIGEGNLLLLAPGRYIKIAILDEGHGIPENRLSRIFDPFYTTKAEGSGLGLSSAYSIVKNHEGQIQVSSRVGQGTTFFVYLPASDEDLQPEETPESRGSLEGTGRILVMDDEDIVRDAVTSLLQFLGYEAATAVDGTSALKLYSDAQTEGRPFSAVIMDLTIPGGMGGREAVRKLKEMDPNAKVIVSSGYFTDPVMAHFREFGFDGVVPKPYQIDELGRVIKDVLAGK